MTEATIDTTVASDFFGPESNLRLALKGFEERKSQKEMSQDVLSAFQEQKIALIEAGTGVGKSLAYLLPALKWAKENNETVLISTNTIALQEQLLEKDIPLALKVLDIELDVVLAKGMNNYLCQRKFQAKVSEPSLFESAQKECIRVDEWRRTTKTGSKSELPFFPHHAFWEEISASSDTCTQNLCSHSSSCFFLRARKTTQEARVIIANHHLLFSDLVFRIDTDNFTKQALLPAYKRIIIDEAHHIEDVAIRHFLRRISRQETQKICLQLDPSSHFSKWAPIKKLILDFQKQKGQYFDKELEDLIRMIDLGFSSEQRNLWVIAEGYFEDFKNFSEQVRSKEIDSDTAQKMRIQKEHLSHPFWKKELKESTELFSSGLMSLQKTLDVIVNKLQGLLQGDLLPSSENTLAELKAGSEKLSLLAQEVTSFHAHEESASKVCWIEDTMQRGQKEVQLVAAESDVSGFLRTFLFEKAATTILCSATLATKKNFSYIKSRLGLFDISKALIENVYDSPFDYKSQTLLGVCSDLPNSDEKGYFEASCALILEILKASRGNAFVLFTSYSQLKKFYDALYQALIDEKLTPMYQGENHRHELITRFKKTEGSVLFGTDSFWEGVDIIGDALRCVIITKLPFDVPTEPLFQAHCEKIAAKGNSPFFDYSIPRAIVKFKQAFGRLIRHKTDRGAVFCLDTRIVKKNYGGMFIKSLPECKNAFLPEKEFIQEVRKFFK